MGFSETIKLSVKKKAHFCCCLCHALGVEVHHIVPEGEGGPDAEDNAAPLCPSCHETYGANPQKRKFVREARDFWYELCEKRYASDSERIDKILDSLKELATRSDLGRAVERLNELHQLIDTSLSKVIEREREVWHVDKLQQKLLTVEQELEAKSLTVKQLSRRQDASKLGSHIAVEMADSRSKQLDRLATEAYAKAIGVLLEKNSIAPDVFATVFGNAFREGPVPDEEPLKVLYHVCKLYKCFIQLLTTVSISARVVPVIVEDIDNYPEKALAEVQLGLAARIRAGELDHGGGTSRGSIAK